MITVGAGWWWSFACLCWIAFVAVKQRQYRRAYKTIVIIGVLFFMLGELYFRLHYFGTDGIRYFYPIRPASLFNYHSSVEFERQSYTGLKRGFQGFFKGGRFTVNNFGFRDKDRLMHKDTNTIRMIVLGGSGSVGGGVHQEEVYSSKLEELLNDSGDTFLYEVINLSVDSYRLYDMLKVLKDIGLSFDPDLILFANEGPGKWREGYNRPRMSFDKRKYPLIRIIENPARQFFFIYAIRKEFIPRIKKRFNWLFVLLDEKMKLDNDSQNLQEIRELRERRLRAGFHKIKNLVQGRRVYIVSYKQVDLVQKMSWEFGFGSIDAKKGLHESSINDIQIYIGDRHLNSKAHSVIAKNIFTAISPVIKDIKNERMLKRAGEELINEISF